MRFLITGATALFVTAPSLLAQETAAAVSEKNALEKYVLDGGGTMLFIGWALGLGYCSLIHILTVTFRTLCVTKKSGQPNRAPR